SGQARCDPTQRRPAMPRATVVLFDVNETPSDLEPLRGRLEQVGAPAQPLDTWFASTLRDGSALAAAGASADFRAVAVGVLRGLLAGIGTLRGDSGKAAEQVVSGLAELDLHPDAPEGITNLADRGVRMATLTTERQRSPSICSSAADSTISSSAACP